MGDGVPIDGDMRLYNSYMGVMHSDKSDDRRDRFITQFFDHLNTVIKSALLPFDSIADEQYRTLLHARLPAWLPADVPPRMSQNAAARFAATVASSNYGRVAAATQSNAAKETKGPVVIPTAKTVHTTIIAIYLIVPFSFPIWRRM
jgi:hypothetical protein